MNTKKNDWVLYIDEHGQPYIEHAWGRRGNNQNHKYIMKVKEGLRTRYFYTQEEVRAYQERLKNTAKDVKDLVVGVKDQAKRQIKTAANELKDQAEFQVTQIDYRTGVGQRRNAVHYRNENNTYLYNSSVKSYLKTPLGKIENTKVGEKIVRKIVSREYKHLDYYPKGKEKPYIHPW